MTTTSRWHTRPPHPPTPRPFPWTDLTPHLPPVGTAELSRILGRSWAAINRMRATGITSREAATLADRIGLTPAEIWPTYIDWCTTNEPDPDPLP
jgi:lambda repressor-like predicted transcriptional regulator